MNVIAKCPECDRPILVEVGNGYMSDATLNKKKTCSNCSAELEINFKLKVRPIKKPVQSGEKSE